MLTVRLGIARRRRAPALESDGGDVADDPGGVGEYDGVQSVETNSTA
jgi:hypothetical protein